MAKFANQKTITTHKPPSNTLFFQVPQDALFQATKNLTHAALKLWLYCAKNADGYKFDFSPADAKERMGLSASSKDRAIKELVELGYLVAADNGYDFYITPAATAITTPTVATPQYVPGQHNISDSLV